MDNVQMVKIMDEIFAQCIKTRSVAHREYAQRSDTEPDNVFANFERQGSDLDIPPMKIWYVYAKKHWDGVLSWINGFKAQRESVKGRIIDLIVYLCLLYAWVEKEEFLNSNAVAAETPLNEPRR